MTLTTPQASNKINIFHKQTFLIHDSFKQGRLTSFLSSLNLFTPALSVDKPNEVEDTYFENEVYAQQFKSSSRRASGEAEERTQVRDEGFSPDAQQRGNLKCDAYTQADGVWGCIPKRARAAALHFHLLSLSRTHFSTFILAFLNLFFTILLTLW